MADEPRRYLLAVGVANYMASQKWARLEETAEEVAQLVKILTSPLFGMERILLEASKAPDAAFLDSLAAWASSDEREESDQLILYWTGHGEKPKGSLKLILESTSAKSFSPAISAHDLIDRSLGGKSRISAALFILDVCYADQGALDIFRELPQYVQHAAAHRSPEVAIIAATSSRATARRHAFARALLDALPWCQSQNRLSPSDLCEEINRRMDGVQQAELSNRSRQARFFREPPLSERVRTQAQIRSDELAAMRKTIAHELYGSPENIVGKDWLDNAEIDCQLIIVNPADKDKKVFYVSSELYSGGRALDFEDVVKLRCRFSNVWRLPHRKEVPALLDPAGVCSAGGTHPFGLSFPLDALFWATEGTELVTVTQGGDIVPAPAGLCCLINCDSESFFSS